MNDPLRDLTVGPVWIDAKYDTMSWRISARWAVAFCALTLPVASFAQTLWTGPPVVFSKPAFSDFTLPENQDRLTDAVWITRGNTRGLFNAAVEPSYMGTSPADTEWAFGSISTGVETLSFLPWVTWNFSNPPSVLGSQAVLHLITDDIYIDIEMLTWGQGSGGGGEFSYRRSTASSLLAGDFNGDGSVDAADYTRWRDGLGGEFAASDYFVWRDNYGAIAATPSLEAIPEPACLALLATAGLAAVRVRWGAITLARCLS